MAYRSPVAAYANPSPSSVPDQFSEIICELRPPRASKTASDWFRLCWNPSGISWSGLSKTIDLCLRRSDWRQPLRDSNLVSAPELPSGTCARGSLISVRRDFLMQESQLL